MQPVQYEGIHLLCLACGCIGHRKDSCPSLVRGPKSTVDYEGNNVTKAKSSPKEASTTETVQDNGKANKEEVYGEWMVVKQKTRPFGRGLNTRYGYGRVGVGFKGDRDDKSDSRYPPRDSKPYHRRDMKRKAVEKETFERSVVEPVLSQSNQTYTQNHRSEVAIDNSGACKSNSLKVSPNHGKKNSMGWESKKWPVKAILNSPLVKENSFSCLGGFTFEAKAQENEYTSKEMGNFSRGQGDTYWRQNDRRDPEGSNRHNGLVREGGFSSLEEHLPPNKGKCSAGLSTHRGRGMDKNSKPVLAFSHGQTNVSSFNQHDLGATRESLLEAPL